MPQAVAAVASFFGSVGTAVGVGGTVAGPATASGMAAGFAGSVYTGAAVAAGAAATGLAAYSVSSMYKGYKQAKSLEGYGADQHAQTLRDIEELKMTQSMASVDAAESVRRRALARRTKTVFTSPLGLAEPASISRKTLLGE